MTTAGGGLGDDGRVVIVGASLAGLRTAESLRAHGFRGSVTVVGDEDDEPYDRPPLSKQVLLGLAPAGGTAAAAPRARRRRRLAPRRRRDRHRPRRGHGPARRREHARLRPARHRDRRAQPAVAGRRRRLRSTASCRSASAADAARVRGLLAAGPRRVLVVGGGFTGSEVASVCRQLGIDVTLVERAPTPLGGALGHVVGAVAADVQRGHGVDLRTGLSVTALEGDGRVQRATLVRRHRRRRRRRRRRPRLGPQRGMAAGLAPRRRPARGLLRRRLPRRRHRRARHATTSSWPATCRASRTRSTTTSSSASSTGRTRSRRPGSSRTTSSATGRSGVPHISVPAFWSIQFGVNIKSVGIPPFARRVVFTQGSVADRSFVAAYARDERVVAAVFFDQAKWLDFYRRLIEHAAPSPRRAARGGRPDARRPGPAGLPRPRTPTPRPSS